MVNFDVLIPVLCVSWRQTGGMTGTGSGKHLAMKQESGNAESMFRE